MTKKRLRTGITTFWGPFPGVVETCNKHRISWPEGDYFIEFGGKACRECVDKARPTRYNHK